MLLAKEETTDRWIQQAVDGSGNERRRYKRYSMFQSVELSSDDSSGPALPAFVRDISRTGVGLVHRASVPLTAVRLKLDRPRIIITTDIQYCHPVDQDWYISYGQFVNLTASDMARLLVATATDRINQRLTQRHPFFRSMSLTLCTTHQRMPVFSRDISTTGIGLFHSMPLERQRVVIRLANNDDPAQCVRAKICWCRPSTNGWYLSGAKFEQLFMEQLENRIG